MAETEKNRVVLGKVSGLYGVRGWLKVHSYTDPREAILDYGPWLLNVDGDWRTIAIAEGRKHGKTVIARLDGVEDRDHAETFVGDEIAVARESMPATASGEFYWADLEGLQVVHKNGQALGKVAYLIGTGANDVLVVQGDRERLIPFLHGETVLDVDTSAGVINVDWEWD